MSEEREQLPEIASIWEEPLSIRGTRLHGLVSPSRVFRSLAALLMHSYCKAIFHVLCLCAPFYCLFTQLLEDQFPFRPRPRCPA